MTWNNISHYIFHLQRRYKDWLFTVTSVKQMYLRLAKYLVNQSSNVRMVISTFSSVTLGVPRTKNGRKTKILYHSFCLFFFLNFQSILLELHFRYRHHYPFGCLIYENLGVHYFDYLVYLLLL